MELPFVPKSTTYLAPGHYWSIPLSDGSYACGIVLAKLTYNGKIDTRAFLAGLTNWNGSNHPRQNEVSNSKILEVGALHVKAIRELNSEIVGRAISSFFPESPVSYTDDISTFGYGFLSVLGEKYFCASSDS